MKLVLGTYSSEDGYNADCEYALVLLTPTLATRILARMDLAARLHGEDVVLHELTYWDGEADFFAAPTDSVWEKWLPEDYESFVMLPDNLTIPLACFQSTEYGRLVINTVGERVEVYWQSSPKNVSIAITTASLSKSFVEQAARHPRAPTRCGFEGGH